MSYYRYITGINRTLTPPKRALRSSSVPRHVPELDSSRYARSSSVPPSLSFSSSLFTRNSATPFRDRASSVPPRYSFERSIRSSSESFHYSDFDCKVVDYMNRLERQDLVKTLVSNARQERSFTRDIFGDVDYTSKGFSSRYSPDSFAYRYNYYDGSKHNRDYLYPVSKDVLGNWHHYNRSSQTLTARNERATSPLVSRELGRYYGTQKRSDYIGSVSSGGSTDFRYYNYRRVPYLGGSDHYSLLNKIVLEAQSLRTAE